MRISDWSSDVCSSDLRLSRPHGAASRHERTRIMAQIGTFTRDESGVFSGAIRPLTLSAKATIRSVESDNDKAPDQRVYARAKVEIGAGWTKTARDSRTESPPPPPYHPYLPPPLYPPPLPRHGDQC